MFEKNGEELNVRSTGLKMITLTISIFLASTRGATI
jgi:hypothetical protein